MIAQFHGLDCDCCKDKIPAVNEILEEVNRIVGSSVKSETSIDTLRKLNSSEFSGELDELITLSEIFFSVPLEEILDEELLLSPRDFEKKVGKFFVRDLSDVPNKDVTKLLDFSRINLSKFDALTFSLSLPTIEAVISVKAPSVSIKMKFLVTRKGLGYYPIVESGVNSKEDALERIRGFKSLQPITSRTNFEKAKSIAARQFPTSKEVFEAVNASGDTVQLIENLSKIGVFLSEEIDIEEEVRAQLNRENLLRNIPVYDDPDCGTPGITPAPFSTENLKEIAKDCCSEDVPLDSDGDGVPDSIDVEDSNPIFETLGITGEQRKTAVDSSGRTISNQSDFGPENILKNIARQIESLNSAAKIDEASFLTDTNSMLDSVKNSNTIMQECSNEKQNALNNYYWFLEASFLNDISLEYAKSRSSMIDSLNGSLTTLENERVSLIKLSSDLKTQENSLFAATFSRLFPVVTSPGITSSEPSALLVSGTAITASQLSAIEADSTFKEAVSSLRKQFSKNETAVQDLSSQIENQKRLFALPTFTESEALNFLTFGATFSGGTASILANKTRIFKEEFSISSNPISNQVGFTQSSILNLAVHPLIQEEAKALFSLGSPESGDVENYIISYNERLGKVANDVWNRYYDPRSVDLLFTYQEQGYTSPKPQYDSSGKVLGATQKLSVVSPVGDSIEQEVSQDTLNLGVNQDIALSFWPNLEDKTREKIIILLQQVRDSPEYQDYILKVRAAGENEAKSAYSANLIFQENSYTTRAFDSYTNSFSFNASNINNTLLLNTSSLAKTFSNQYKMVYDSLSNFRAALQEKLIALENFIELKKKCIADQENAIAEAVSSFSDKTTEQLSSFAPRGTPGPEREDCASILGSDPLGLKTMSDCPGITKNCYWKEYTKLMQIVSLMPIPDDVSTGQTLKRLFRYYPVALQFPVPSLVPTLASGIPDATVSVPLPIVWKHVITVTSPVGLFVVWIGICGPIIGPYIMYIDEAVEPCFLVTPKGPYSIPAKSLKISETEEKSLLDILSPLKDTFQVPVSAPNFSKLLGGNGILKTGDPDDITSVIDKMKEKIKAATDKLEVSDPWALGATSAEEIRKFKARVSKALRNFPPDIDAISQALRKIEDVIDQQIDSINIQPIKFPQNPKKLATPLIGPAEFIDTFNKLLDSGTSLKELGLGIKTVSLREKMKKFLDEELSDPAIKQAFLLINQEISELENFLSITGPQGPDREKILARVKILKKAIKAPLEAVANKITPEMLGFLALASIPLPLPEPCYTSTNLDPLPPYIIAIIAAIKDLPGLLDRLSDEELVNIISKFLNINVPLPRIEDSIFFLFQAFLSVVPDIKLPDTDSLSMFKQIIKTTIQNFFKLKVRLPRPGAIQITIPPSLIKEAIKLAVKTAFGVIVALVIKELTEAKNTGSLIKVLAVAAIIKGVFGTDLGNVTGDDIKAFLVSSLESISDYLDSIKSLIQNLPLIDFKSIKETLFATIPPKISLKNPPFLEVNTEAMLNTVTPLLQALQAVPFPFPVILLAASQLPGRVVISKVYPFAAKELLPSWEKLSLQNIPFVIWLDQLIATAQKSGGISSDYVAPYFTPDI